MARFAPFSFVKTAIEESRKVIWPNRQLVIRHTIMVVISVAISAVLFAGIDYGLQKLVIVAINQ